MNGVTVCIDGNDFYFLANDGTTWVKKAFLPAINIPNAVPQTDPASTKFILHDGSAGFGNVRDGQFQARIACCSLDPAMGIRTVFDQSFTLDRNELLGTNTTPTCDIQIPPAWKSLGPPRPMPEQGSMVGSLILGKDVYVTYSFRCASFYGPNGVTGTGPNQAGLLCGSIDNPRWTKLKLLDFDTSFEELLATSNYVFLIAAPGRGLEKGLRRGLRSVQLTRTMTGQPNIEIIATHFTTYGGYSAVADGNTVHVAWLDGRRERDHPIRSMLTDTPSLEGNWELYYRQRSDSDSAWSKEILLSKGLDFTYDPHMAVEGQNVVVVFGGYAKDGNKAVARLHPSDIYFTTSRDGGKTWKPPARLTNNATTGLTSVRPHVALHRDVIHLIYTSGGVIYQRRPFPKN